jgi:hypothetical protein
MHPVSLSWEVSVQVRQKELAGRGCQVVDRTRTIFDFIRRC